MHDQSDIQLLRDYATTGSEPAFHELVTRHTDFVFSAALRQVESPDLAADLAQSVFTDLARKARPVAEKFPAHSSLAGWLHRSTRYAALNHLRDTRRRQSNERQAMEQLLTNTGSAPDWEHIRPVLDEALDSLDDDDREALLQRFFQKKDFRAVGLALGVSDDTAQKRVSRAVEHLRDYFSKRKITIGTGALAAVISANALQAAPAGLAAVITTAASTSSAIAVTKTIAMTTLQKIILGASLAAAIGTGILAVHQNSQLRAQNQNPPPQPPPDSAGQIQQLQDQLADLTNRLAGVLAENARLDSASNRLELLKLRGVVGVLHRQNGELLQDLQNAEKLDHPVFPTNFVSRDSLAFAGYDTPENALKSGLWAKSIGDEKTWRRLSAPEMTNLLNSYVQGNTDEERSQFLIDKTKALTGYRILSETPVAADEVLVQTEYDWQANGASGNSVNMEVLKHIDGEWKLYDEYANSDQVAELVNALNSKNSTTPDSTDSNPAPVSPVRVIGQ